MKRVIIRTINDDELKIDDYFYIDDSIEVDVLEPNKETAWPLKKMSFIDTVYIKFGVFDNKFGVDVFKVTKITKYKIESTSEDL